MNIFGFNISISRTPAVEQRDVSSPEEAWLRGEVLEPGGVVLSNAYEQVVWVYRAINVLAEQVANIPFRFSVGEAGGEHLITDGPLHQFYARPHPQFNRFQYWELRVIWLMLRGECFRIPVFETAAGTQALGTLPGARLRRVLMLDPAHFQHIVEDHQLIGWRYTGFGPQAPLEAQVFLPEEVWFEKLPNPFDFWRGLSPLAVADLPARTDFAAGAFMKGLIENNADSGLIVRTEKPMDPKQAEQIRAALRLRKRRAGTADQPLLLSNTAEILQPTLSSSDLQFLDNRKFSRAEICAAFGVPEEIVTTTDTAKYDVMAGARLNFIENRVAPLCRRLEAEEEVTVRALDPRAVGWFDLDSLPILEQARRNRLASAKTGFDLGIPFNELNRVLELGFKPLPWGDEGWVPAGMRRVGEAASLKSADRSGGANGRREEAGLAHLADDVVGRALELLEGESWQDGQEEALARCARRIEAKLRKYWFEQRGRVLAGLENLPVKCASGQERSSAASAAAIFELPAENQYLADALKPVLLAELAAALQALGSAPVERAATAPAEYWAARRPAIEQLNVSTSLALQALLAASPADGAGLRQAAALVKGFYNSAGRRLENLARTEAAALQAAVGAVAPGTDLNRQ